MNPKTVYDVIEEGLHHVLVAVTLKLDHDADGDARLVADVLRCSLDVDHGTRLCADVVGSMRDAIANEESQGAPALEEYYDVLCDLFIEYFATRRECHAYGWLQGFFLDAVVFMLSEGQLEGPRLEKLVQIIRCAGGASVLNILFKFQPHILRRHSAESLQAFARAVLVLKQDDDEFEYTVMKAFVVGAALDAIELRPPSSHKAIEGVEFAFEMQASSATVASFLARVLSACSELEHADVLVAVDVLTDLHSRGMSLSHPFLRDFSASVVCLFSRSLVLLPVPKSITAIRCRNKQCPECLELRAFLEDDTKTLLCMRKKLSLRSHIETQLHSAGLAAAGVTWQSVKPTVTRCELQITKPREFLSPQPSVEDRTRGAALMTLLGDVETQRQILGQDYDRIARLFGIDVATKQNS
nr:predicted protein [Mycena chlorophos]